MDWPRLAPFVIAATVLLPACPDDPLPGSSTGSGSGTGSDGSTTTSPTTTEATAPSTTLEPGSSDTADPDSGTAGEETCIEGTWTGVFEYGFEVAAFAPCDGEPMGSWWYEGPADACGSALVTVTGTVCGPGKYGHLGGYAYGFGGTINGDPCLPAECDVEPVVCGPFAQLCDIDECSLDAQDCGGQASKCVPASTDGLPPWTETECVPVARVPIALGQACTIDPPNDDCEWGSWCIPDAPGSGTGTCVRLCSDRSACSDGECVACDASELLTFGVCAPPACMGDPECPGAC